MSRSARRAAILLVVLGVTFVAVGATGLWIGIAIPERIERLLPSEALIDAAGVGGATVALGTLAGTVGVMHVLLAPAIRRGAHLAVIAGITLSAMLGVMALASGVASLVTVASGLGLAVVFVPVAIGLGMLAALYGWLTAVLIGLRKMAGTAD